MKSDKIIQNALTTTEYFFKLPALLFVNEKYKHMSLEAKVMYAFFYSRMKLSEYNGEDWMTEDGTIYFFYERTELMSLLGCGKNKVIAAKKELIECGVLKVLPNSDGRAERLTLNYLDGKGIELDELKDFSRPLEDKTKISQQEKLKRSENKKLYWDKQKNRIEQDVLKEDGVYENIQDVLKEDGVYENQAYKMSRNGTPDVPKQDTRYIDLNKLDNNIDYVLDHSSDSTHTEQGSVSKLKPGKFTAEEQKVFDAQFIADVKHLYAEQIVDALRFMQPYESPQLMHRLLQNALNDLLQGKCMIDNAKMHIDSIRRVLFDNEGYRNPELAGAVYNTLVRLTRSVYSGTKAIKNPEGYYYTAIQKTIVEHINRYYDLKLNEGVDANETVDLPLVPFVGKD
ncbi:MAG: replication initiator protein A [Aerococcaceae bacterium]|nr:replication initiator protein A [Aerococcaceae bacterium]